MSVIIADRDESTLGPFLHAGTPQHEALQEWLERRGGGSISTQAAAIRALLHAGADLLNDELLDQGYRELSREYEEDEARMERRRARDRYVERTEAHQ